MTTWTRRYRFPASHRLHSGLLSEVANRRTFGKCNNSFGHGHDYVLDVSITGDLDPTTGLIVRLADLDRFVATEILQRFSYRNLNEVADFATLVPTTENVALVVAARLGERWAGYFPDSSARLSGIAVQETDRNSFEVLLPQPLLSRQIASRQDVSLESNESVIVNA